MMRRCELRIRGKSYDWAFRVRGTARDIHEWRGDGLQIDEVVNSVPSWVYFLGLAHVWCWVEDNLRSEQEGRMR